MTITAACVLAWAAGAASATMIAAGPSTRGSLGLCCAGTREVCMRRLVARAVVVLALGSALAAQAQEPKPPAAPAGPGKPVEPTKAPDKAQSKPLSHRYQFGLAVRAGTGYR